MYNLITTDDIKKGDLLVIEKVAGRSVHASVVDTSTQQVRTGPKWKPKPERPGNPGNPGKGKGKNK